MDQAARVAFIQTQVVCAMAEIEAMKAANTFNARVLNHIGPYMEADFRAVPDRFGLGHNAVLSYLQEG